ncbi:MAG: torD [Betaproteobacteria bacterium]|nr:torD [Betaproteobacteria bacterium]
MTSDPDQPAVSEEDRARADSYALISRLFYGPADAVLLQQLGAGPEPGLQEESDELQLIGWEPEVQATAYSTALHALQATCRTADAEALRQEYDDLFAGAGKALVTPYTSGYAVPHAPDRHLLALREHLVAWGLARRDAVFEIEDHVSAVCDVMRWLIQRERPIPEQLAFFNEFVYTGLGTFCNAIDARATTPFYKAVADLARSFLAVEKEAFDLHATE